MIDKQENRCAHPGCSCSTTQDEKYCSPYCETAPPEAICGCGHADCIADLGAQVARPAQAA
ncbi:MAG: hypothetical protein JST85_28605 [Acidobacteria bacterium]|nr:hypothetical protein [Acidobacteriota bacterium]